MDRKAILETLKKLGAIMREMMAEMRRIIQRIHEALGPIFSISAAYEVEHDMALWEGRIPPSFDVFAEGWFHGGREAWRADRP